MSTDTVTVDIGGCIVTVGIEADFFAADRLVIDRVREFVDDLRRIDGATKNEPKPVVPVHLPPAAPVVIPKPAAAPRERKAAKLDCPYGCGKSYRRSSMYKHRTICPNRPDFTTADVFTCPRCFKHFAKRNGLSIHVKTCKVEPAPVVDDPAPTECEHCGYPLKTIFDRMRHEESCSAKPTERPDVAPTLTSVPKAVDREHVLRCSQCGETYGVDELDQLEQHMWDVHNRSTRPHERRPRTAAS